MKRVYKSPATPERLRSYVKAVSGRNLGAFPPAQPQGATAK